MRSYLVHYNDEAVARAFAVGPRFILCGRHPLSPWGRVDEIPEPQRRSVNA